jgi:hypothetical protein
LRGRLLAFNAISSALKIGQYNIGYLPFGGQVGWG